MKSGRYKQKLEAPNLVEEFEARDQEEQKRRAKKEWTDGGVFTPEDNPNGLLETSSFTVLFPQYREPYIKEHSEELVRAFKDHTLDCTIDLVKGTLGVSTTSKTFDPFIIIKGRDVLKLISRGVSVEQARRLFQDDITSEVLKISNYVKDNKTFESRRQRIIGPDGATLKAIELLTKCYILIQGKTVSIIGTHRGIKEASDIIISCMQNIHPIYNINRLMVKRELEKNPNMQDKDWQPLLPEYAKKTKSTKIKRAPKKPYTPFPPAPEESKMDQDIRSGVYFLNDEQKKQLKMKETKEREKQNVEKKRHEKEKVFIAPKEEIKKNNVESEDTKEFSIQPVKRKREEKFEEDQFIEKKKKKKEGKDKK